MKEKTEEEQEFAIRVGLLTLLIVGLLKQEGIKKTPEAIAALRLTARIAELGKEATPEVIDVELAFILADGGMDAKH